MRHIHLFGGDAPHLAEFIQVLYGIHLPHFVGIDVFETHRVEAGLAQIGIVTGV